MVWGVSMKIICIYTWKEKREHWLDRELRNKGYSVKIVQPSITAYEYRGKWYYRLLNYTNIIRVAVRALKEAENNDVIIGWACFQGVLTAFLSRFTKKDVKVIAMNNLGHEKNGILKVFRNGFYKTAFGKGNLITTANSQGVAELIHKRYGIDPAKIFILSDAYDDNCEFSEPVCNGASNQCFAGGYQNRDWNIVSEAAGKLPDYNFLICAGKRYWDEKLIIHPNMKIKFDVCPEEFWRGGVESKLIIVPLDDAQTAGLVVLIRAIQKSKLCISTDTDVVSNYYPESCKDLLVPLGDSEKLAEKIKWAMSIDDEQYLKYVTDMQEHLLNNFSPQAITNKLLYIFEKANYIERIEI